MMEVGDAIVSLGRRTLEDAIQAIEAHPDWNAKVVYGDTDSLFVALEGAEATNIQSIFALGREIAQFITERNPEPVKLKFEKIYTRSILMAKKRYIGWKAIEEAEGPVRCLYEAKGVESVRRDYCPLAAKVLEKFCSLLFEHGLASGLKYFTKVCSRLLQGYYAASDLILTKPWRPGTGLGRWGDRICYLAVVSGSGDKKCLIEAEAFDTNVHTVNYEYYATKQLIPVLERCIASLKRPPDELHNIWKGEMRNYSPPEWKTRLSKIDAYLTVHHERNASEIEGLGSLGCANNNTGRGTEWKLAYAQKHQEEQQWRLKKACRECMQCTPSEANLNQCVQVECPLFWRAKREV